MTQAYPLQWPIGWPRATHRQRAQFGTTGRSRSGMKEALTVAEARSRLANQLDALGARYPTLSTNLELRLDGLPRSGQPEPRDVGVAVYFQLRGKDIALACDKWDRVGDNIAAVAKHIEAIRGQERWGVGTAAQAFAGYERLAAPEQWWDVLGVAYGCTRMDIERAYRGKAKAAHPDAGGSRAEWDRLVQAYERAKSEVAA